MVRSDVGLATTLDFGEPTSPVSPLAPEIALSVPLFKRVERPASSEPLFKRVERPALSEPLFKRVERPALSEPLFKRVERLEHRRRQAQIRARHVLDLFDATDCRDGGQKGK
jgi:hypothetical protein